MNSIKKLTSFQQPFFSELQNTSESESQTTLSAGFIGTSDRFETFQSQASQPFDLKVDHFSITQTPGSVQLGSNLKSDREPIYSKIPAGRAGKPEVIKTPESQRFTQMLNDFKTQFQSLAADPQKFHAILSELYKPAYSYQKAEAIRKRAIAGDYKWIPQVKFVSSKSVGDKNGVYTEGPPATMYVNERLLKDPTEAARVFARGIGNHLDHLTNKSLGEFVSEISSSISHDSGGSIGDQMSGIQRDGVSPNASSTSDFDEARGNEGEKFRAALAGEPTTLDANSENTIELIINGRTVTCEIL